MATLCLAEPTAALAAAAPMPAQSLAESVWAATTLRDWLAGDWGLLFSHPEDFQEHSLEQDRWLTIVGEELRACGVKPLACATQPSQRDASWASRVMNDWRTLRLDGPVADLAARALRPEIAALGVRFVLLVDAGLRRRAALPYRPARMTLSPLDLAAAVSTLRRRPRLQPAPATPGRVRLAPAGCGTSSGTRVSSQPPATKNAISTSGEARWLPVRSATVPMATGPSTAANLPSML